jgi:hypothetical protein
MNGEGQKGRDLSWLNFPGLAAGIALIILPFLGAWWVFTFGTDAVVIATSPFTVSVQSFGSEVSSPLMASLNLALKIVIIYYGGLLLAGSVLRTREDRRSLADFLVRISARKFLWLVLLFVLSVAVTDLVINQGFVLMGVPAQVPYLTGDAMVSLHVGSVSLTVPVIQGFTGIFTIAVLVAILSLVAYLYQEYVTLVRTDRGLRFRCIQKEPQAVPAGEGGPAQSDAKGK